MTTKREIPPRYDTMLRLLVYDNPATLSLEEKNWRNFARWIIETMITNNGVIAINAVLADEGSKAYYSQPPTDS